MKGLEEIAEQEKQVLENTKLTFTPRGNNKKPEFKEDDVKEPQAPVEDEQTDEENKNEPSGSGSSWMTYAVIGAALTVAGASYLRYISKK